MADSSCVGERIIEHGHMAYRRGRFSEGEIIEIVKMSSAGLYGQLTLFHVESRI